MRYILLLLALLALSVQAQTTTVGRYFLVGPDGKTLASDLLYNTDCKKIAQQNAAVTKVGTKAYSCNFAISVKYPDAPTSTWTKITDEDKSFVLAATTTVRFGSGTAWVQKDLPAGTYTCSIATFGSDPINGTFKQCQASSVAPTQPTTPTKPADLTKTVACVAPLVGSWTQTATWTLQNNVWVQGAFTPTSAPSGACVPPVVTPPASSASGVPDDPIPPTIAGTTYYLSSAGSAAASGTSATSAKQSIGQLPTLKCGDAVLFRRGDTFPNFGWTYTTACTPDKPVYFGAWGDDNLPRPILNAPGTGFRVKGRAPFFHNLDLRGARTEAGISLDNVQADATMLNVSISGFNVGFGGDHYAGKSCTGLRAYRSQFFKNAGFGYLGDCNKVEIVRSAFDSNGAPGSAFDHNWYGGGASGYDLGNDDVLLAFNTFTNNLGGGKNCASSSVTAHGAISKFRVLFNTIIETGPVGNGCWGIDIRAADGEPNEGFKDVLVAGNRLVIQGSAGNSNFIVLGNCQDCVVEDNVVDIQMIGGSSFIGISIGESSAGNDLASKNVTVRNNSVWAAGGSEGQGVKLWGSVPGVQVGGNLIYLDGSQPSSTCFAPNLTTAMLSSNLCFKQGTKSALDSAGLTADPLVSAPTAANGYAITPAAGSPIVGACKSTVCKRTNIGAQ